MSVTHLLGSFPVVLFGLRFAVFSLQPIKPDKTEIWAPRVINEYKALSVKWNAPNRNIYCPLVRGLHKISQAALAGLCHGACQNPSWMSYLWVDSWQETSHFHLQGKEAPASWHQWIGTCSLRVIEREEQNTGDKQSRISPAGTPKAQGRVLLPADLLGNWKHFLLRRCKVCPPGQTLIWKLG